VDLTHQAEEQGTFTNSAATAEETNNQKEGANSEKDPQGSLVFCHFVNQILVQLHFLGKFAQMRVKILVQIGLKKKGMNNPQLPKGNQPKGKSQKGGRQRRKSTNLR
jgi:hypothetical protein